METSFRKWLEVISVGEPPKSVPDAPWPSPFDASYDPKSKLKKKPGASQTNAFGDYHAPGSEDLPPDAHRYAVGKKAMKKK